MVTLNEAQAIELLGNLEESEMIYHTLREIRLAEKQLEKAIEEGTDTEKLKAGLLGLLGSVEQGAYDLRLGYLEMAVTEGKKTVQLDELDNEFAAYLEELIHKVHKIKYSWYKD